MDALDTLYIMEMTEEFEDAADWVEKNLDFNVVRKRAPERVPLHWWKVQKDPGPPSEATIQSMATWIIDNNGGEEPWKTGPFALLYMHVSR